MTSAQAIRALNEAAYAAIKAVKADPRDDISRVALFEISRATDVMVDALSRSHAHDPQTA